MEKQAEIREDLTPAEDNTEKTAEKQTKEQIAVKLDESHPTRRLQGHLNIKARVLTK